MTSALTEFQDDFVTALLHPDLNDAGVTGAGRIASLTRQPGFAVYRNTVLKGCIDALQANYPAITRLVGEEWFRAAAAIYARTHPPRLSMLAEYGDSFADFLAGFGPAQEYPYLPDVARLDRLWTEAHTAADAPALAPDALTRLAPEQLADVQFILHPAARWRWFPDMPIYTIWSQNRQNPSDGISIDAPGDDAGIAWHAEGALITRDGGAVRWTGLSAGGCAFLDTCTAGAVIADVAEAAMAAEPELDLAKLIATLLSAGALSQLHPDAGQKPRHSPQGDSACPM